MTTFVGDPLYRPFPDGDQPAPQNGMKPGIEYAACRNGARAWYRKGRGEGEKRLEASARELQSGIVWEGLGLLQWSVPDYEAARASFRQAQACYGITEDGLRTVLDQIRILKAENSGAQARTLAGKALGKYGEFHGAQLLREVIGLPSPAPGHNGQ